MKDTQQKLFKAFTNAKNKYCFLDSNGQKGEEFYAHISIREDTVIYLDDNNTITTNTLEEFFCDLNAIEVMENE